MDQNTAPTNETPVGQQTAPSQTAPAPGQTTQAPTQGQPIPGQQTGTETQAPAEQKTSDWLLDIGLDEDKPTLGEDGKPLLAGRYKDVGELEKAYKELQGQFTKLTQVPEKYEVEPVFKEQGLAWKDAQQEAHVTDAFKSLRLSNEQAAGALKLYKEAMSDVLAQYGPPTNPVVERATLERNWGDQVGPRTAELKDFVKTLPKEVSIPLIRSAAGMEALWALRNAKLSPTVVKETKSGMDVQSMRAELNKLAGDPKYYSDPTLRAKAEKLAATISGLEQSAQ